MPDPPKTPPTVMPVPAQCPEGAVAKSTEFERILIRLNILEQSLLYQVHDKLAKSIAKEVVKELKGTPHGQGVMSMPQTPLSAGHEASVETISLKQRLAPDVQDKGPKKRQTWISDIQDTRTFSGIENGSDNGIADASTKEFDGEDSMKHILQSDDAIKSALSCHSVSPSARLVSLRQSQSSNHAERCEAKLFKLHQALRATEVGVTTPMSNEEKRAHSTARKDTALDLCVGAIVVLNSVIIGVSMDYNYQFFQIIDVCFTACFLVELILRFCLHGVCGHFSQISNCLDFMLVVLDVVQLTMEKILESDALEGTPSASLFRIVRLARLVRLIRLARLHIFDDLVAMITGIIGGMSTLVWSMALLGLIVYVTSLLFREFYGNAVASFHGESVTFYFRSVPRAMLTVFRYFFGDFNTALGTSLFEAIQSEYGPLHGIFVVALFFMISVGVFNVIASIFVESTMSAALAVKDGRKHERMNDETLWNENISMLVRKFFEYVGCDVENGVYDRLQEFSKMLISQQTFSAFINDKAVIKALEKLEIGSEDHKYLFDILDNDNTGEITVTQLSDGVERLRGDPRRSDIICVDLMVRSIQEQANFLVKAAEANLEVHGSIKRHLLNIENRQLLDSQRLSNIESLQKVKVKSPRGFA